MFSLEKEGVEQLRAEWRSAHGCTRECSVLFSEQEVGAQWRSAYECTREYRCVTVMAGGCRKSEQSGGVHVDAPESKDVLCLEQEVVGGWCRGEECM
jgi:hypothetical protein